MMIADLVDHDDLYQRLHTLGAPIEVTQDAAQMCQLTASWLSSTDTTAREAVQLLMDEFMAQQGLLHPEVLAALKTHLMPAL